MVEFTAAGGESVLRVPTVIPPPDVVVAFGLSAESLLARTLRTRRESFTLAAMRDALLPKLMSGEVRVGEAARDLEAVG